MFLKTLYLFMSLADGEMVIYRNFRERREGPIFLSGYLRHAKIVFFEKVIYIVGVLTVALL